jgi:hypothetical protein
MTPRSSSTKKLAEQVVKVPPTKSAHASPGIRAVRSYPPPTEADENRIGPAAIEIGNGVGSNRNRARHQAESPDEDERPSAPDGLWHETPPLDPHLDAR